MPAITLREVIAELAAGARIVSVDGDGYELQYPGTVVPGHMLTHELVSGGWLESTNGGSYRLSDAGRLAYMRSTDELGSGDLVPPATGAHAVEDRCASCGIRYGYHLARCAALTAGVEGMRSPIRKVDGKPHCGCPAGPDCGAVWCTRGVAPSDGGQQ